MDYDQRRPLGFLYLLKAVTSSLGFGEHALRLVPLICGLGTIAAFYLLTRRIFSGWALVAVNLLMCVNQTAISYSAQAKQYSLELLVAVLMLLLSRPLFDPDCPSKVFWINSLALGLLLWFSFSSVFVLVGIGLALVLDQIWARPERNVARTAGALLLFGALFIPVYAVSMRPGLANPALRAMWMPHYFPLHALSEWPRWIAIKIEEVCVQSFNNRLWPLAGISILFGLVASVRRRDPLLLTGTAGAAACLGAAVLQKYPFSGLLIPLSMPASFFSSVQGINPFAPYFRRASGCFHLIAAAALLWCVASAIKGYGVQPSFMDEPREALRFVRDSWQPGDRLYATRYSTPCVVYYTSKLNWPSRNNIALNVYALDGAQHSPSALSVPVLTGRDWLVEMRTDWDKRGESVPVREYFEARGQRLAGKDVEWTSATLYQIP